MAQDADARHVLGRDVRVGPVANGRCESKEAFEELLTCVCMYVCMYVCRCESKEPLKSFSPVYVCMYVCMYVGVSPKSL